MRKDKCDLPPDLELPAPADNSGLSGVSFLARASATALTSSGMSARVRGAVPLWYRLHLPSSTLLNTERRTQQLPGQKVDTLR